MKQYQIERMDIKNTVAGKLYMTTVLKDDTGASYEKVNIWQDFPNFKELQVNSLVTGELKTNEKGYTTLYPKTLYGNAPRASGVNVNMEKKQTSIAGFQASKQEAIENSQERKEHAIMVASTAQMATQILTATLSKETNPIEWRDKWIQIRYWLVKNWQNIEQPKVDGTDKDYPQNNLDQPPF